MKLRAILKSKIHRAVVTGADIDYVGSVGVDQDLLERTDIIPGERVRSDSVRIPREKGIQ